MWDQRDAIVDCEPFTIMADGNSFLFYEFHRKSEGIFFRRFGHFAAINHVDSVCLALKFYLWDY